MFIEWRKLPEDNRYWISEVGEVLSTARGLTRIKKTTKSTNGYAKIRIGIKHRLLHRMVAQAFLGVSSGLQVNHKDGNKLNNSVENLEYVTASENIKHAYKLGLKKSGENHCNSKLKEEDILAIRQMRRSGVIYREIAAKYKIDKKTVWSIVKKETWKNV